MGFTAEIHMTCDGCGTDETTELERGQSPDEAIDTEGWYWGGTLLDRLLCGDCYEKEEAA